MCTWASVREPPTTASPWPLVTQPLHEAFLASSTSRQARPSFILRMHRDTEPSPSGCSGLMAPQIPNREETGAGGAGRAFKRSVNQRSRRLSLGHRHGGWGVRQDGSERRRRVMILALELGSSGSNPSFALPPSHLQLPHLQREDISEDGISYSQNPIPRAQ